MTHIKENLIVVLVIMAATGVAHVVLEGYAPHRTNLLATGVGLAAGVVAVVVLAFRERKRQPR
jgi:hypothetical protein